MTGKNDRLRILVIDDDQDYLRRIPLALGDQFDYALVSTIKGALETLDNKFDLVIIDFRMPDGNATLLAEEIKKRWPEIKIIGMYTIRGMDTPPSVFDKYVHKTSFSKKLREAVQNLFPA